MTVGYLLLLPVVVSLMIPWATKIHVTWLGLHAAVALGISRRTLLNKIKQYGLTREECKAIAN